MTFVLHNKKLNNNMPSLSLYILWKNKILMAKLKSYFGEIVFVSNGYIMDKGCQDMPIDVTS